MSVPPEDYVHLHWTDPRALTSNVLDLLAVSDGSPPIYTFAKRRIR